jgi:hypothetical protein
MSSKLDTYISYIYIYITNQLEEFKWQKLHTEVRGFK